MRLTRGPRLVAALVSLALPAAAHAQGFGLNEIGTCALARGFAATSRPCDDGSSIYWNPGAIPRSDRTLAALGVSAVAVSGDFRQDFTGRVFDGDVPVEYPPHLFVSRPLTFKGRRASVGLGVYVPYGLTSRWRDDFPGRFLALKASLTTVYVQPNVAIEVVKDRVSVGIGPVWGHSSVELRQAVDLSAVPTSAGGPTFGQLGIPALTDFARAHLDGSATGWGFNVGVAAKLADSLYFGARYLHRIDFDYDADATFTQVNTGLILPVGNPITPGGVPAPLDPILAPQFTGTGPLAPQRGSTTIAHPWQFQTGVSYEGIRGGNSTASLEGTWVGWKAFEELPIDFHGNAPDRVLIEDYNNSWSLRAGLENRYVDKWTGWSSRVGFAYVHTPAPDETVTPLLPDMDRYNFGIGLGVPLARDYALDLGYLAVRTRGRRGRVIERTDRAEDAAFLNSGAYRLTANVFALSLRARF